MTAPTLQTVKKLFALSGNRCAFPGCSKPLVDSSGVVNGEICHIHARSKGGPRFSKLLSEKDIHAFQNLLLLCAHHHNLIDSAPAIYTAQSLFEVKDVHESTAREPERAEDAFYAQFLLNAYKSISVKNNSGNVAINSPGSIQGTNVTIKQEQNKVEIEPPPGSIGTDLSLSGYISHLIERYNEFSSKDPSRTKKFNFGALSKNIESKFGARWKLLSTERAHDVIGYIQDRIMRTRLARINSGKGYPAFSSLEEYKQKYGHKR